MNKDQFFHPDFGIITWTVKNSIANVICEVEYTTENGDLIGCWAYGSYDPSLPYKGEYEAALADKGLEF